MAGFNAIWPAVLVCFTLEAADGSAVIPPAAGIPGPERAGTYRVTAWTTEHGLPDNRVQAVLQTRDGFLWLATVGGLVRFDGVRFKVFTHHNVPGNMRSRVTALGGKLTLVSQPGRGTKVEVSVRLPGAPASAAGDSSGEHDRGHHECG